MAENEKEKLNFVGLTVREMGAFFLQLGEKAFRGRQVYVWVYRKRINDFSVMTDVPAKLREKIIAGATLIHPVIDKIEQSSDGATRKYRIRLKDDLAVEAVLMDEVERVTLCISTQVGCSLGCTFCATGYMGFQRNLTVDEIVGQYLVVQNDYPQRITNIVLMGMGEPLLNYEEVAKAVNLFADTNGIAISNRHITLSTVGIIPGIERMMAEQLPCKLAISLNAPDDQGREYLMPINKKYPLEDLFAVLRAYQRTTRHRITFEYVMISGLNDTPHHAVKLKHILGGFSAKLNLIPYNPFNAKELAIEPENYFAPPSDDAVHAFQNIVFRPGLTVIVRKSRGSDISAACGQLCVKNFFK
jgi:23S rRNA (adenine2503-C2)-methyltransferase